MSYGIVRVQKFKATGCKGIEIHDLREKEFVSHTNPDIDWERIKENYSLHQARSAEQTFYQAVKERIAELHLPRAVRKDAVVMAQALFTSDNDYFKNLAEQEQRRYFERCYDWAKERFGDKNIISATVHLDEHTPHMHVNFVPVTEDGRLSAKDVLTPARIREMHDLFYEQVGKDFGLARGEVRDPEEKKKRHLETADYKIAKAEERAAQAEERAARTEQEAQKKEKHIEALSKKEKALESKIEGLERKYKGRISSAKELDAIKPQATLTGAVKGVTVEQIQNLKKTAFLYYRTKDRNAVLEKKNQSLEVENAKLRPLKLDISTQIAIGKEQSKYQIRALQAEKLLSFVPEKVVSQAEEAMRSADLARNLSRGPSR